MSDELPDWAKERLFYLADEAAWVEPTTRGRVEQAILDWAKAEGHDALEGNYDGHL